MRFEVTERKSADEILNYFNSFHDGFIKRIEIASQDYFESAGSQVMTREFIVTVDFCHHNYQNRYDNYTQVVRAIFRGVCLFSLNTSEFKEGEWCICDMSIEQSPDTKFKLIIDGRCLLSFSDAVFEEI